MQERSVTDFNAVETSGFSQRSFYVRGTAGVRATHGSFATAYVQTMCSEVSRTLSDPALLAPGSVSVHGLRTHGGHAHGGQVFNYHIVDDKV